MKNIRMKLLGVILLLLFATALVGCEKKKAKVVVGGNGSGLPIAGEDTKEETTDGLELFIYKAITKKANLITFIKVGGAYREYTYSYDGATMMYDRFDALQTTAQLRPGTVYCLEIDENTQTVKTMRQSKDVWVYDGVTNFNIDLEKNKLTVGAENYQLPETVPVFDGKEQFMREQIGDLDQLVLMGYDKTLISIQIATGHGKIKFKNADKFKGGYFVLGNVAAAKIKENKSMEVRAGSYILKIAGEGQGGSKKVKIRSGKTTIIDLKEFESAKKKICKVKFEFAQEGVDLYIAGTKVNTEEEVKLPYGVYKITAKKEGFDDWTRILFVNSSTALIPIDLTQNNGSQIQDEDGDTNSKGLAGSLSGTLAGSKAGNDGSTSGTANSNNAQTGDKDTGATSDSNSTNATDNSSNALVNEVLKILTNQQNQQNQNGTDNKN